MGQRFWARHNCWVGHSHFGTEATKVLQFWNGKNVHSGLLTNTKTWWWPGEYTTLFMLRRLFTQQVWPKDDRTAATWRTMELNAHIHRYCVYPDMARRGTAQHDTARHHVYTPKFYWKWAGRHLIKMACLTFASVIPVFLSTFARDSSSHLASVIPTLVPSIPTVSAA